MKNKSVLLNYKDKVELGSYYTPKEIVAIVKSYIKEYVDDNTVLMDNSAGGGAFFDVMAEYNVKSILTDIDPISCEYLTGTCNVNNIFCDNSLLKVSREKYGLTDEEKLIIIGNPPYNDFTSKSKKKLKKESQVLLDQDLKARDLGVSFLKSYNKLKADYVCVLHPLAYLIKESNFKNLKEFKDKYKLIKGTIFSSALFYGTKKTSFPIVIALYERNQNGMNYEDILNFHFEIKDENKIIQPYKITTTDKYIRKYQPKKTQNNISDIGVYFYPFRDINSLKTSKSFISATNENENKYVVVNKDEFYKYCYLNVFKYFFESNYVFGNFSPIVDEAILNPSNDFIKKCMIYSFNTNKDLIKALEKSDKEAELLAYYKISKKDITNINNAALEVKFNLYFEELKNRILSEA